MLLTCTICTTVECSQFSDGVKTVESLITHTGNLSVSLYWSLTSRQPKYKALTSRWQHCNVSAAADLRSVPAAEWPPGGPGDWLGRGSEGAELQGLSNGQTNTTSGGTVSQSANQDQVM